MRNCRAEPRRYRPLGDPPLRHVRRPAGWRYAVDSFALTLGQLLATASLAVVAILSARVLGPTGRGELTLVLTIVALVQIVGTFGIAQAGVLLVARGEVTLPQLLGLGGLLAVLNGPISGVVTYLAMHAAGEQLGLDGAVAAGLHGSFGLAALAVVGALQADGRFRIAAVVNAVGSLATLLTAAALGLRQDVRPVHYLLAMIAGNLVQCAAGWFMLRQVGRPQITIEASRRFLRTGVPIVGLNLGQTGAIRSDRYLIGAILDARATGLYSVAATAAEMIRVLPFSATMVLMQRVSGQSADESQIRRAKTVGLLITATLCGGTALVAPTLVGLVFGNEYAGAVPALRILLLAELTFSVYLFEATVVAGRGRVDLAAVASLLGFAVVVILDIPMIHTFGIEGAAWASVLAYLVMAAVSSQQRRAFPSKAVEALPIIAP